MIFMRIQLYKKLEYVFYMFCICFVYVFKKSTVFIRNWLIFHINYIFLILYFLYVFKKHIQNIYKTYKKYILIFYRDMDASCFPIICFNYFNNAFIPFIYILFICIII